MNLPIESILANLIAFYDFRGKHVIHVGAGGGSLIGYAGLAGHVTAIDNDPAAVTALRDRIGECRDRDRSPCLLRISARSHHAATSCCSNSACI